MSIYYYLSVFPTEAFIASQLAPEEFGYYMATGTGTKVGSFEKIIFIEIKGEFGSGFDWDHAKNECVPHPDGRPKHSVYLSVYRALENIPLDAMKEMYLTTEDGRTLQLSKEPYTAPEKKRQYFVYQELCPIHPLVASSLTPDLFTRHISGGESKIYTPKIVFTDLKVPDFDNLENSGNLGRTYDRNLEHLKSCINSVLDIEGKKNKTIERSHIESFSFQIINRAIYIGEKEKTLMYKMKSQDELRRQYYDWARSAQIM